MQVSNKAICDFKGQILTDKTNDPFRQQARVLLSEKELLLVLDTSKRRIPIKNINSTRARITKSAFDSFFGQGVIIRYYRDNKPHRIVIGGRSGDIADFRMKLFGVLIGEPHLLVKHPNKIGGVVKNSSRKRGKISFNCIDRNYSQGNQEKN